METQPILVIAIHCTFIISNLALLCLPVSRHELKLWRRFKLQRLRRRLTAKSKVHQPLDSETVSRSKKNIVWHIALTAVMLIVTLRLVSQPGAISKLMQMLTVVASIGWFFGSLVQRQKIALLNQMRASALQRFMARKSNA
jgi:hypothetical protein